MKLRLETAKYILGTFIAKFDPCCVYKQIVSEGSFALSRAPFWK
jgi:hypothetical protein